MTGGMISPPVEATASTAPATLGSKPTFFMSGMVIAPVPTTLATALPLMEPNSALPKMAIFAGPPRSLPKPLLASSRKNSLPPSDSSNCPNSRKMNTWWVDTPKVLENTPSVVI